TSVLLRRLKQKEAMVAEVNDSGEVTVEGEFVGRLDGFRFIQDKAGAGQEAKALAQASLQALAPHFNLRADRFYNAPDTEIDFTEQGGLIWGENAVGKLTAGSDPLKPVAVAFVDDVAGSDVAQKVQRRLQHFIDRKVATLFEPLLNISKDETLTGLSRGFGFQMVENLGVIPRGAVADDVKALDQDARAVLRKHGVRFGQFTIFMPLLLKPAPTRLRLVLWSLAKGLQEFPEAPPPGLVTVPAGAPGDSPDGYFAMAGYRAAGERAIRIDMLERLADMLRVEDSRGGFEAKPDMLSITGMTLEQFADLMQGLGYKADRGEREKVRVQPDDAPQEGAAEASETVEQAAEPEPDAEPQPVLDPEPVAEPVSETNDDETEAEPASDGTAETAGTDAVEEGPEIEVFYTFTWGGRKPNARPQEKRQPRRKPGKKPGGKPHAKGPKTYSAKPGKSDKIDPDNPFAAALMGLKDKS
ncbi:MAG: disulfide oxidoreductase, partial [Pseudomonadota bacterium]